MGDHVYYTNSNEDQGPAIIYCWIERLQKYKMQKEEGSKPITKNGNPVWARSFLKNIESIASFRNRMKRSKPSSAPVKKHAAAAAGSSTRTHVAAAAGHSRRAPAAAAAAGPLVLK